MVLEPTMHSLLHGGIRRARIRAKCMYPACVTWLSKPSRRYRHKPHDDSTMVRSAPSMTPDRSISQACEIGDDVTDPQ